ncbi:MAG: hypothetical protein WAN87_00115 [Thermoplasmata archaeon]
MTSAEEVERVLTSDPSPDQRILNFAGLLQRDSGSEVIIVGGSAIEVHSRGKYHSDDLDLRGDREAIRRVLARWGFRNAGKIWLREDWKIAVDVVGTKYTGDPYRAVRVETKFGPVRVAVVEDLIIKRLAEAKHWKTKKAIQEAAVLWADYRDRIDFEYLNRQAREYDVVDLLADFRERLDGTVSD